MKEWARDLAIVGSAGATLIAGLCGLVLRREADPNRDLAASCALARDRRFDQAQAVLVGYLRAHPDDAKANLLMAQFALDRPDPHPNLALEHLRKIGATTPQAAAVVQFCTGKAHYQRARFDLAEAAWKEAIRLDPTVPEAGWALFDLLGSERRGEEAHELGLRLHESEPDRRDRVRYLLELARLDLYKPDPASQAIMFEPVARQNPENLPLAVTVGQALIRASRSDQGLEVLRAALGRHPGSLEAWDAWLTGLDEAGRPDEFTKEFARLPEALAADPRFAKHEGLVAQRARDWRKAVHAFKRALAFEPFDGAILFRLGRSLHLAGDVAESERVDGLIKVRQKAVAELQELVDGALAVKTLGVEPQPKVYERMAEIRERLGRPDEAKAWHRLLLLDQPEHAPSLAALKRLS